jgi:hypothetical protein
MDKNCICNLYSCFIVLLLNFGLGYHQGKDLNLEQEVRLSAFTCEGLEVTTD